MTLKTKGVTLLEFLLALVVMASIVLIGVRTYESYFFDVEVERLRLNIDTLFQGLTNYYYAQCIQYQNKRGDLDPVNTAEQTIITVDPNAQLKLPGFISRWPFPNNSLIDNTANSGYKTQFNRELWTRQISADAQKTKLYFIGSIYLWRAQVAVKVLDPKKISLLRAQLQADCTSSPGSTGIAPCAAKTPGNYLVWERLPSFASPKTNIDYWPTLPTVEQFTQMYTTFPILSLTDQTMTSKQYYLCGG